MTIGVVFGVPSGGIAAPVGFAFDLDNLTLKDVEDLMIQVYAPHAMEQGLARDEALAIAREKDLEASRQLVDDYFQSRTQLNVPVVPVPDGNDIHIGRLVNVGA